MAGRAMFYTTSIPEPFKGAIDSGRAMDVVDLDVSSPWDRFARGLARTAVGHLDRARKDFDSALDVVGDPCRIELAFLDLRKPGAAEGIVPAMCAVADRAPRPSLHAPRALVLSGL